MAKKNKLKQENDGVKSTNKPIQLTTEEIQEQTNKKTAQDWLPLKDLMNGFVYTKDDYVVGYIAIEPFNLDLYGTKDQRIIIGKLSEALNGEEEPFIWYSTDRPADLEPYLEDLKYKAETTNNQIKRKILTKYASSAREKVISGDLVEKRFYMMVRLKNEKKVELLLSKRLDNLVLSLRSVGLQVKVANEKEVYELLSIFSDPANSLFDSGNYTDGKLPIY